MKLETFTLEELKASGWKTWYDRLYLGKSYTMGCPSISRPNMRFLGKTLRVAEVHQKAHSDHGPQFLCVDDMGYEAWLPGVVVREYPEISKSMLIKKKFNGRDASFNTLTGRFDFDCGLSHPDRKVARQMAKWVLAVLDK